jgi:hypothetical protein
MPQSLPAVRFLLLFFFLLPGHRSGPIIPSLHHSNPPNWLDYDYDNGDCDRRTTLFRNPLPQRDLGRFGDHLANPRQHAPQVRLLQVPVQVRLARPVLVKQKQSRVIDPLVQVVVEATFVLSTRSDQRQKFPAHIRFLPGFGIHVRDRSESVSENSTNPKKFSELTVLF